MLTVSFVLVELTCMNSARAVKLYDKEDSRDSELASCTQTVQQSDYLCLRLQGNGINHGSELCCNEPCIMEGGEIEPSKEHRQTYSCSQIFTPPEGHLKSFIQRPLEEMDRAWSLLYSECFRCPLLKASSKHQRPSQLPQIPSDSG